MKHNKMWAIVKVNERSAICTDSLSSNMEIYTSRQEAECVVRNWAWGGFKVITLLVAKGDYRISKNKRII